MDNRPKHPLLICRCEHVDQASIQEAIQDGAISVSGVKRRTRAGMGICQGRTCQRVVANLVSAGTGRPLAEVLDASGRTPVRPSKISMWEGQPHDPVDN